MQLAFGFALSLLFGFAFGNGFFSEETISAFNFGLENEIFNEQVISSFSVLDYGATGNGQIDDSQAFNKAWKDICNANAGGEVVTLEIPRGKTFLLNPLVFQGPCKAKAIHIQLGGTLIAPLSTSWANGGVDAWIQFSNVDNLYLDGDGKIDGRGSIWWQSCMKKSVYALHFNNCNGLQLKGLTHLNSPRAHISIKNCKDVIVSDLKISAPDESPNTDGIDISDSYNVQILQSIIGTGDDCVAINAGSSFINITGVVCGPGHGISIGSLGDGGDYDTVEQVHVKNCTLRDTQNGMRIKTFQGRSGYARKISFEQIVLSNARNPIIINQFYQDKGKLSKGIMKAGAIEISDVTYSDIRGTSANGQAIDLRCDNVVGCSNIVMRNIDITPGVDCPKTYAVCNNAHGTATETQPRVPCLS
ncbi:putative polygalacturonase [Gossypium australe]|uniref:Putative polygalacturonase n=1 Tax=Gossypium australe TaxID=47621 RepID=A0A5B6WRD6_9ROSI|nr:putative polygalacturonase [Gossypium australe]